MRSTWSVRTATGPSARSCCQPSRRDMPASSARTAGCSSPTSAQPNQTPINPLGHARRRRACPVCPGQSAQHFARLNAVLEALRLRQRLELLQRVVLNLPNSLARHAEGAAHLLERARLLAEQAEAELDHLSLTLGQSVKRPLDVLAP